MFDLGDKVKVPSLKNQFGHPCIGEIIGMAANGHLMVNVLHVGKLNNNEVHQFDDADLDKLNYDPSWRENS